MSFHFIRPLWLLAIIPCVIVIIMLLRKRDPQHVWRGVVAAHLLPHLITQQVSERKLRPHGLLGAVMILCCLALAGPSWQRQPAPFADDEAALVIALAVTPSMMAQDIQPTRLERASQKIKDLLERRRGADTSLIAYSGSAHLVMPLTGDGDLIAAFANELAPEIMPHVGDVADKAVALARAQLAAAGRSGSVLLLTDYVAAGNFAGMEGSPGDPPVHVYGMAAGPEAMVPADSPPAPPLDRENLKRAATAGGGSLVVFRPDASDIDRLAGIVETEITMAAQGEGGDRWQDAGFWLVPLIVLLSALWFRPGWAVSYE